MTLSRPTSLAFCLALALLSPRAPAETPPPGPQMAAPGEVVWGPASPKLPPGALMAVLSGDPAVPGAPYTLRAKLPDGYSVPPHWHPMDENITVLQGTMRLGMGRTFDREALRDLPAGSYALLPKEEPHYNLYVGETIIQLHGIGPYDIHYVDPADDASRQEARDFTPPAAGRGAGGGG